jgi:hypothetical protein
VIPDWLSDDAPIPSAADFARHFIKPRVPYQSMRSYLLTTKRARDFVKDHGGTVGIYCRITDGSNVSSDGKGYPANVPWFTFAPTDREEIKPLTAVGKHWECVEMVRPDAGHAV